MISSPLRARRQAMSDGAVELRGRKVTFGGGSWLTIIPRGEATSQPGTGSFRKSGLLQTSTSCPSLRDSLSSLPSSALLPQVLVSTSASTSTSTSTSTSSSPCPSATGSGEIYISPERRRRLIQPRSTSHTDIRHCTELNWRELEATALTISTISGLSQPLGGSEDAYTSPSTLTAGSSCSKTAAATRSSRWEELFTKYTAKREPIPFSTHAKEIRTRLASADEQQTLFSSPREDETSSRSTIDPEQSGVPPFSLTLEESDVGFDSSPRGSGIVYEPKSRVNKVYPKATLAPPPPKSRHRPNSANLESSTSDGDIRARSRSGSFQEEKPSTGKCTNLCSNVTTAQRLSHEGRRKRPHSVQLQPQAGSPPLEQKRAHTVHNHPRTATSVSVCSSCHGVHMSLGSEFHVSCRR